jgi:hypothetical protein
MRLFSLRVSRVGSTSDLVCHAARSFGGFGKTADTRVILLLLL